VWLTPSRRRRRGARRRSPASGAVLQGPRRRRRRPGPGSGWGSVLRGRRWDRGLPGWRREMGRRRRGALLRPRRRGVRNRRLRVASFRRCRRSEWLERRRVRLRSA